MTAAIYARVSKDEQHTENQIPELAAYAQRNGWETVEYLEEASGKEGGKRPVLAKLLADARLKKFDAVAVWKIDRFGRSLADFVSNVQTLDSAGVRFISVTQGIDTDQRSPIGKMLMNLLMLFAEFERDLIVERVNLGVRRYKRAWDSGQIGRTKHSRSGEDKAHGRPKKIFGRDRALALRKQGWSWRAIGKELGVSHMTAKNVCEAKK